MDETITIPVDVDTRKAKADLAQLHEDKKRAKKRITSAARRTSRMATRAFAFSGAASVVGKFQNDEPSGNVDIYEEALVPFTARVQEFTDKKIGLSGKARRSAREQTKAAFAYQVGRTGDMVGMHDFFNTVNKIQSDVESGRNLIRQDPRFVGPDFETVGAVAARGHVKLFLENLAAAKPMNMLMRGFDYLVDGITAE